MKHISFVIAKFVILVLTAVALYVTHTSSVSSAQPEHHSYAQSGGNTGGELA